MEWTILIDIENLENCSKLSELSKAIHDHNGIQSVKSFTAEHVIRDAYRLKFVVIAEQMPLAMNLMKALVSCSTASKVTVTRTCWDRKTDVPFQWAHEGAIAFSDGSIYHKDTWDLCVNNVEVVSVHYVPTFTKDWTLRESRKYFNNALFCLTDPSGKLTPLNSLRVEDALKEAEDSYLKNMKERLDEFERKASEIRARIESFNKWKEK